MVYLLFDMLLFLAVVDTIQKVERIKQRRQDRFVKNR